MNVTGDILKTLKVLSVSGEKLFFFCLLPDFSSLVRNCDQILSNNGARTVCLLLKEKKHSALAVDTLWNLFEYSGNKQVVASQLSSFTCIRYYTINRLEYSNKGNSLTLGVFVTLFAP